MTLEAALTIPIFLAFVLFLASMIRISVADMALDRAVSETGEAITANAYPVALAKNAAQETMDNYFKENPGQRKFVDGVTEMFTEIMDFLDINITIDDVMGAITGEILTPIVKNRYEEITGGSNLFKPNKFEVDVHYTSGINGAIEITGTAEIKLFVPFIETKVTLKKRTYEGFWSVVS